GSAGVAGGRRRWTGRWSGSLLPPVKLYLGNPVHLAAGGGNEGANSGVKSNDPEAMPSFFSSLHRGRASRHGLCGCERWSRRSLFVVHRRELRHVLAFE